MPFIKSIFVTTIKYDELTAKTRSHHANLKSASLSISPESTLRLDFLYRLLNGTLPLRLLNVLYSSQVYRQCANIGWVRSIWDKSKVIWMWTLKCKLKSIKTSVNQNRIYDSRAPAALLNQTSYTKWKAYKKLL